MSDSFRQAPDASLAHSPTKASEPAPLSRRQPDAAGIPPQFANAWKSGTGDAIVSKWFREGRPASLRAERRAKRERSSSLGRVQNNPTPTPQPAETVMVCATGCGRQACPGCRIRIGMEVRRNLTRRLKELQREHLTCGDCQMWTLTVDQGKHESAEAAYDSIRERERVSKLARRMGWKYWVAIVEWHESGWPHWHVVVWAPVPRMYYSKDRVQEVWAQGNVWYTGSNGRPAEAAYKYATKYMTKPSEYPAPEWVLERTYVRMVNASRDWGGVRRPNPSESRAPGAVTAPSRDEAKANREAMSRCGQSVTVIRETIDENGEEHREFMFRADVPYRSVRKWMANLSARSRDPVKVCMRHLRVATDAVSWDRLQMALSTVRVQ